MKVNIKTLFSLFAVFLLVFGAFGEAYAKGGFGGGGRGGGFSGSRGGFSSSRSSGFFSSSRSSSYSRPVSAPSRASTITPTKSNAFTQGSTATYTSPKWAVPAPKPVTVPKPTISPVTPVMSTSKAGTQVVTTKTITTSPGFTTTRKVTTVSSSKPVPLSNPTSVVTPMSEKCRRDRLPYSYCRSRGYWHPDQDRYAHNDSGSGAVVAGIATGVAVGALLSSNNSHAAPSQTVVVQAAPTAPGVVPAPVTTTATQPQPLIKPFTLINDCSDWVCK